MNFSRKIMPNLTSAMGPFPLSEEQLQFYWDNGYIIIQKLFDISTLNAFRDRFVEICNNSEARKYYSFVKDSSLYRKDLNPEMYINKIQDILYDDVYMKYSEDPRILHIVSEIIGEDLTAVNCMLINKPPGSDRHPPHQDLYYFPFRPANQIIGSWTAIDKVARDNGCLFIVPGSHKIETMYLHRDMASVKNQFFHGIELEDDVAPEDKRVDLEMEPGDTLLFHPYLVHGSRANVSQRCRKAITSHYANSKCHYINVRGTPQQVLADQMETVIRQRGGTFYFNDLWRLKSKPIKGFNKCHL